MTRRLPRKDPPRTDPPRTDPRATPGDGAGSPRPPWTRFVKDREVCPADGMNTPGILWVNSRYTVIARYFTSNPFTSGRMIYLSIRNNDRSARHDWRDFQQIKNELAGPEWEAVELYPAESRLIDESNQFHLCCYNLILPLGFNQASGRVVGEATHHPDGRIMQRPFEPHVRPKEFKKGDPG